MPDIALGKLVCCGTGCGRCHHRIEMNFLAKIGDNRHGLAQCEGVVRQRCFITLSPAEAWDAIARLVSR